MSCRSKGPRLYLRSRKGRSPTWVILDGPNEIGTSLGPGSEREAEKVLADYLAKKHTPQFGRGDPAEVLIADVLTRYADDVAPGHAKPELVGIHLQWLLRHFGTMTCADISASTSREYTTKRKSGKIGRRPVKEGTARRELETLSAALNFAYREKLIAYPVPVTLPEKAMPRERWLTRSEAARLLLGALGWTYLATDVKTRKPSIWKRVHKPQWHVARFILIGVYTGTRHAAILRLSWIRTNKGGMVDLEQRRIYRRGNEERETKKRRPPVPIPDRLHGHLSRARKSTINGPVEYGGQLIEKLRRGFNTARALAYLGADVTPHVLRHTCATWLLQLGVSTWDVAGFLGTTEDVIRKTYGHHAPDYLSAAVNAFSKRVGPRG